MILSIDRRRRIRAFALGRHYSTKGEAFSHREENPPFLKEKDRWGGRGKTSQRLLGGRKGKKKPNKDFSSSLLRKLFGPEKRDQERRRSVRSRKDRWLVFGPIKRPTSSAKGVLPRQKRKVGQGNLTQCQNKKSEEVCGNMSLHG